uniref:Ataxin-2 C-terminal domain-containing protein n=1 Tax=Aegilops tauschii subsp. strangulata TaxID=200361 RepID=A0A453R511_AEGTS
MQTCTHLARTYCFIYLHVLLLSRPLCRSAATNMSEKWFEVSSYLLLFLETFLFTDTVNTNMMNEWMNAGRPSPGPYWQQGPPAPVPPQGPHYYIPSPRAPPPQQQQMGLMPSPGPAIYHQPPSQPWYWCPPDYQYPQAMMTPQMMQNYYAQLYAAGLASPTGPPPYHQYVGYMQAPTPRAAVLSPVAQQIAAGQPYVPHPAAAQMQGFSMQVPSLPHNFALQLPSHAVSLLPPNATDVQSAGGQASSSAAAATNANITHQGA